jgi:hypothetical protein
MSSALLRSAEPSPCPAAPARKGLLLAGRSGLPVLTAEGLAYNTGIAAEILHGDDH